MYIVYVVYTSIRRTNLILVKRVPSTSSSPSLSKNLLYIYITIYYDIRIHYSTEILELLKLYPIIFNNGDDCKEGGGSCV